MLFKARDKGGYCLLDLLLCFDNAWLVLDHIAERRCDFSPDVRRAVGRVGHVDALTGQGCTDKFRLAAV
ncbi:hypothetical protein D3C84_952960 [compost metagenome]